MRCAFFPKFLLLPILAGLASASMSAIEVPKPESVLSTLEKQHPRLLLKDKNLEEIKALMPKDDLLKKCVKDVIGKADKAMRKAPLKHEKIGPRLLQVSRDCLDRIYSMGLAWRLTGKREYADKVKENLLTVCAFQDWNPSHFLDVAEMSHAVGIGYDWLYPILDEPTRKTIREGLIRHGMKPGLAVYYPKPSGWANSDYNWNQVCNGGLIIGALAIAETDPEYAQKIVPAAVVSLPKALKSYDPDGAWGEGPGYWSYATHYTCFALAALQSALGTDFGLSDSKSLALTGYFPLMTAGPTGYFFNFADVGSKGSLRGVDCLFWLARRYDKPDLANAQRALLARGDATPWDVIWYLPAPKATAPLPLDRLFNGPVPVAVFHGAWNDPNALFIAIKGGYNQVNHGHLDLGQFEMDALGQRWARDLGSDDYNLPGYFSGGENAKRWTYYRLMSESHNVPLLNNKNQNVKAKAERLRFKSEGAARFAVVDLTTAYLELARRVTRGVTIVPGPQGIAAGATLIQDEFDLKSPCEVAWGMTTEAKIAPQNETATLSMGAQQLRAMILSPAGAKFSIEPTRERPEEKSNKGFSRLMIRLPGRSGQVTVAVLLAPVWPGGKTAPAPNLTPLESWK